mmetsp:Transcript_9164/g.25696  ORF Transcript_9164/g.25696 Transcript_9164/m.25696 type:complete len:95 (-) Transcript_9164:564-848(-)
MSSVHLHNHKVTAGWCPLLSMSRVWGAAGGECVKGTSGHWGGQGGVETEMRGTIGGVGGQEGGVWADSVNGESPLGKLLAVVLGEEGLKVVAVA